MIFYSLPPPIFFKERFTDNSVKESLEERQELVNNEELSMTTTTTTTTTMDNNKSNLEETLGHMTLEELDQPSTSAES